MKKKNKGITLVALVITIILLLILAGITITQLTNNGLFEKAKLAKEKTNDSQKEENEILSNYISDIDKVINSNNRDIANPNEIKFYNTNQGFQDILGETATKSYGLSPETFQISGDSVWKYEIQSEKIERRDLNSKFEISFQLYFNNENTYDMGGIRIIFFENEDKKVYINISDGQEQYNWLGILCSVKGNTFINQESTKYNGSGRYTLVSDGDKIYFYWGTKLLGSIENNENISYDKIKIEFFKYDNSHNNPPIYIESLYVGEPFYSKSMLTEL